MMCQKRVNGWNKPKELICGCICMVLVACTAASASSVTSLHVVEKDGGVSILRDGRVLVESMSVDRGGCGDRDVKRSFKSLPDGSRVWNFWSEVRDRRFRLEVAERSDGAIEITMTGTVDPSSKVRRRRLTLDVPTAVFDGREGTYVKSLTLKKFEVATVRFGAEAEIKTRFLAVDGLVFDFNPTGPGDYRCAASDGWRHTDTLRGIWNVKRTDGGYEISACGDVLTSWGGYTGAKLVIRKGVFSDFDRLHSRRTFAYSDPLDPMEHEPDGGYPPGFYLVSFAPKGCARQKIRVMREIPKGATSVQPLIMDGEDFSFRRGPWVSDGYEPDVHNTNGIYKNLPVFGEIDDGEIEEKPPSVEWTKHARIVRVLNNSSSLAEFDAPDELNRYFDSIIDPSGANTIMLSGMLSRHTYIGQIERGLKAVKRFTEEAHRRGYKVIDHMDVSLLWNIGGGWRVMAERLDELARNVKTGLPCYQLCIMNPEVRRKFYEYAARDVLEGGVDGLQIDEAQFWANTCCCVHCRRAFERDTGWDAPIRGDDRHWQDREFLKVWYKWRNRKATDFLVDLRECLRSRKPDLVLSSYTTEWGLFSGEPMMERGRDIFSDSRAVNFFGVEVMSRNIFKDAIEEFVYHSIAAMIPRDTGASLWNWYYNQDWKSDYVAWALDQMTAQISMLSEVDHPAGTPDYANFKNGMKRQGAEHVAEIALEFSVESRNWRPEEKNAENVILMAKHLCRMHVPFDVIDDRQVAAGNLSKYKVVAMSPDVKLCDRDIECARIWRTDAPSEVLTELWKESDGSWAVHFLNLNGSTENIFKPLCRDIHFTLPSGKTAMASSPDFPGLVDLKVEKNTDGSLTVTLDHEHFNVYTFVRVSQ